MATGRRTSLLIGIGAVAACSLCLQPIACRPNPKAIIAQIPLGSRLSELDQHMTRFYVVSSVEAWTPNPETATRADPRRDKYGAFDINDLGPYDDWIATREERERFTGELRFFHYSGVIPDDIDHPFVLHLVYVDGVLKEAEIEYFND